MARSKRDNYLSRTFHGLAAGYFMSFILGTICQEIGQLFHFSLLNQWGTILTYMLGPVIGITMAWCMEAKGINLVTACLAGMIGAGTLVVDGSHVTLTTGSPFLAYLAVILTVEVVRLIQGKTSLDWLLAPIVALICSGVFVWFIKPFYLQLLYWFQDLMLQCIQLPLVLMGMCVALLSAVITTSPLTSLFLMSVLSGLDGVALGCALAGVCGQMVGLAVMSIHDNPIGNVLAVSIGTSFLQFKNIIKRPLIWVPPLIASLISGILTALLSLSCTVQGASLGLTGLIGLREAMHLMSPTYWIVFILIDVVLPMGICFGMYKAMRKLNYIKSGDMYISGI